jgi:hypothetical protein
LAEGEAVRLVFAHDSRNAVIGEGVPHPSAPSKTSPKRPPNSSQGSLF